MFLTNKGKLTPSTALEYIQKKESLPYSAYLLDKFLICSNDLSP